MRKKRGRNSESELPKLDSLHESVKQSEGNTDLRVYKFSKSSITKLSPPPMHPGSLSL